MFVIDDKQPKFLSKLTDAFDCRGVNSVSLNDYLAFGITSSSDRAGDRFFVGEVQRGFDCNKDKTFISFLKSHKFRKAFLVMSDSEDFKMTTYFNSAVTVLNIPASVIEDCLVAKYYLNVFLEFILNQIPNLPCASPDSKKLVDLIRKIAPTDATVLITGQSGTGKEVISNLLHSFSNRNEMSFVALNCAAIPEQMLESILFGHEKGAFTGAIQANKGLLRAAHGGTILLDEISEMPITLQSKLLRVIQEKKVMPIGSSSEEPVDVRIIATTNRNMMEEVKLGNFREDLFYRLNVFPIYNLPLAARLEDVIPIVAHILSKSFFEREEFFSITAEAIETLMGYNWPGNVRELDNVVQRAKILSANKKIESGDLIFDTDSISDKPNTAEILAAKFKASEHSEVL